MAAVGIALARIGLDVYRDMGGPNARFKIHVSEVPDATTFEEQSEYWLHLSRVAEDRLRSRNSPGQMSCGKDLKKEKDDDLLTRIIEHMRPGIEEAWQSERTSPTLKEPIAAIFDLDDEVARITATFLGGPAPEEITKTLAEGRRLLSVWAEREQLYELVKPFMSPNIVEQLAEPSAQLRILCMAAKGAALFCWPPAVLS